MVLTPTTGLLAGICNIPISSWDSLRRTSIGSRTKACNACQGYSTHTTTVQKATPINQVKIKRCI